MILVSVIIPVYNRPDEVQELLDSLTMQVLKEETEVIVVDDGSQARSDEVVKRFEDQLDIKYIYQDNKGPGGARNEGAKHAVGHYLIFLDSDCVLPTDYLKKVQEHLKGDPLDCFGGPDRAHAFFTPIQKAISYSMTSVFTTGGIRGGKKKMDSFYPRSFNLGVRRDVFLEVGGFSDMRYGEDIDFSMSVKEKGYRVGLVEDTFVYHKRRTKFKSFYKQVFSSGTARIDIASRHSNAIKLVHLLPSLFTLGIPATIILGILVHWGFLLIYPVYFLLLFSDATARNSSVYVGLLSGLAGFIQLIGYGLGFITAAFIKVFKKNKKYTAFKETFYD